LELVHNVCSSSRVSIEHEQNEVNNILQLTTTAAAAAIGLQPLEQYLIVSSQRGPAALVAGLGRESALQRAAATALVYFKSSIGRQCLADSSGCGTLHICIHTYMSETSGKS
jgi:hypothetical protein